MKRKSFAYWNEVFFSVVCMRIISMFDELFSGGVL